MRLPLFELTTLRLAVLVLVTLLAGCNSGGDGSSGGGSGADGGGSASSGGGTASSGGGSASSGGGTASSGGGTASSGGGTASSGGGTASSGGGTGASGGGTASSGGGTASSGGGTASSGGGTASSGGGTASSGGGTASSGGGTASSGGGTASSGGGTASSGGGTASSGGGTASSGGGTASSGGGTASSGGGTASSGGGSASSGGGSASSGGGTASSGGGTASSGGGSGNCGGSAQIGQPCAVANACEVATYQCVTGVVTCVGTGTPKASTVECRASAGVCDVAESCNGSSLTCPSDSFAAATVECHASAGVCDPAETCTGTSAACPADTLAPNTTVCRASAGTCDVAETCTGSAVDCPADTFAPNTTVCRASAGVCDPAESCTGSAAACPADTLSPNTTVCRASAGVCDSAESCTGTTAACPADGFLPNTTVCRASAGVCDSAESCTGTTAACPADGFLPNTTVCRASAGVCDSAESCTGTTAACPADGFLPNTTVCRASAGVCDSAESCTGTTAACPADGFLPNTTVCRASAGVCDSAESCTGTTAACPADGFLPNTTVCRASAGVCDSAESCTGTAAACPANAFLPNTTVCRASAGVCDSAESCTGTTAACPADGFLPNTTVCRASAGVCDSAESCTGTTAACPADGFLPNTTVCRASAGVCDSAESCTGTTAACPANAFLPNTTVCRASAGVCDSAENCTGAAAACPGDSFLANTTVCRAAAGLCDVAENCTGAAAACPGDTLRPNGFVCRADSDGQLCDAAELCSGGSSACPADTTQPAGTACVSGGQGGTCSAGGACNIAFGPDLTFSTDGDAEGVTPSPGSSPGNERANSAAIIAGGANAGKLAVVGTVSGSIDVGFVARFNTDGSLDTTYGGGNGYILFPNAGLTGTYDRFESVVSQPDGKLIIGGSTFANDNADDILIIRLNDDGSFDNTFGNQGRFTYNSVAGGSALDRAAVIALQSDGKVVFAGISRATAPATFNKLYFGRLNTNGTLDTGFGGPTGDNAGDPQGFVTDTQAGGAASSPADQVAGLAIDALGRIYGAGFTRDASNNNVPAVWRLTSAGRRDTTWDGDGRYVTGFLGGTYDTCVIDNSNRLVVGGRPDIGTALLISRWSLSTGALDTSFDTDGHVSYTLGSTSGTGWTTTLAIQSDDKIVGGDWWGVAANNNDIGTFRLNVNGSLDTSFSGDGFDVQGNQAGGGRNDTPTKVFVLGGGQILMVGSSEGTNGTSFPQEVVVTRYTSGGALDTLYGGGDGVTLFGTTGWRQDVLSDIALRSDGTVVGAGWTNVIGGGTSSENGALWAFNASGAPLTTFNTTGTQYFDSTRRDQFFGIAADGLLSVVTGYSDRAAGGNDFAVARYTSAGALDTSFCTTGMCLVPPTTFSAGASATGSAQAHDVVVRPAGGYVVVGTTATASAGNDAVVVAFNSNGTFDGTFGTSGVFLNNGAANGNTVANSSERLYAVARQSDGKFVVVGAGASGATLGRGDDLIVMRLNANGTLDTSFDGDGIATYSQASASGSRNDSGRAVAIQSDGAIVIAGWSTDANSATRLTVWRLTSAGALDTTFNTTGYFVDAAPLAALNVNEQRVGVGIDGSGRIYVAASRFAAGTGIDLGIWRLTSAGALDTTFDGDGIYLQHNAGGGNGRDFGHGLLFDSGGKLMIGGQSRGPGTNDQDGIVWRF